MYKWDEMTPKERDWLIVDTFEIASRKFFDWAWESGQFNFSSNISLSWKIVKKLKPDYIFELRVGSIAESARFTRLEDGKEFIAQLKKASESIGLAALKAVGVGIE